ncbi:hypothetical protein LCGC14_2142400, partial [marine sediment metagenome]
SSLSKSLGLPKPDAQMKALWDTGATVTGISFRVVKMLDLGPTRKIEMISGTDTKEAVDVYTVDLLLPNGLTLFDLPAVEPPMLGRKELGPFDIIIGMDVIKIGDFAVTSENSETWFSFRYPPGKHIDFLNAPPVFRG